MNLGIVLKMGSFLVNFPANLFFGVKARSVTLDATEPVNYFDVEK